MIFNQRTIPHKKIAIEVKALRFTISFIPCGAKTQKIKIIDHNKCNVRASKNAEQAFSTQ